MAKDDTQKMLRIIINGQSSFRQEVLKKFDEVDKKFNGLDKKIDKVDEKLTKRIDAVGRQLAYLEDDAPTREEFGNHEKRIRKLEQKPSPSL